MTDTDTLRELAKAATSGPWETGRKFDLDSRVWKSSSIIDCICTMQVSNCPNHMNDARFVAACNPTAILELLDRLSRAESACASIKDEVARHPEHCSGIDANDCLEAIRLFVSLSNAGADFLKEREADKATIEQLRSAMQTLIDNPYCYGDGAAMIARAALSKESP